MLCHLADLQPMAEPFSDNWGDRHAFCLFFPWRHFISQTGEAMNTENVSARTVANFPAPNQGSAHTRGKTNFAHILASQGWSSLESGAAGGVEVTVDAAISTGAVPAFTRIPYKVMMSASDPAAIEEAFNDPYCEEVLINGTGEQFGQIIGSFRNPNGARDTGADRERDMLMLFDSLRKLFASGLDR